MEFSLHTRLAQDCMDLGRLTLCRVLLMNDSRYPWLILVPERESVTEIYQLDELDQHLLIQESSLVAALLAREFRPDKMNIAAIGNLVPQLHLHHVVRYRTDAAWPDPVWGRGSAQPYADSERGIMIDRIQALLPALDRGCPPGELVSVQKD